MRQKRGALWALTLILAAVFAAGPALAGGAGPQGPRMPIVLDVLARPPMAAAALVSTALWAVLVVPFTTTDSENFHANLDRFVVDPWRQTTSPIGSL